MHEIPRACGRHYYLPPVDGGGQGAAALGRLLGRINCLQVVSSFSHLKQEEDKRQPQVLLSCQAGGKPQVCTVLLLFFLLPGGDFCSGFSQNWPLEMLHSQSLLEPVRAGPDHRGSLKGKRRSYRVVSERRRRSKEMTVFAGVFKLSPSVGSYGSQALPSPPMGSLALIPAVSIGQRELRVQSPARFPYKAGFSSRNEFHRCVKASIQAGEVRGPLLLPVRPTSPPSHFLSPALCRQFVFVSG